MRGHHTTDMIVNIILDIKDEETDVALYDTHKTYEIAHTGSEDLEFLHMIRNESWYLFKLKD